MTSTCALSSAKGETQTGIKCNSIAYALFDLILNRNWIEFHFVRMLYDHYYLICYKCMYPYIERNTQIMQCNINQDDFNLGMMTYLY